MSPRRHRKPTFRTQCWRSLPVVASAGRQNEPRGAAGGGTGEAAGHSAAATGCAFSSSWTWVWSSASDCRCCWLATSWTSDCRGCSLSWRQCAASTCCRAERVDRSASTPPASAGVVAVASTKEPGCATWLMRSKRALTAGYVGQLARSLWVPLFTTLPNALHVLPNIPRIVCVGPSSSFGAPPHPPPHPSKCCSLCALH